MKTKYFYILGLITPIIFFGLWICQIEYRLYNQTPVEIAVKGYDPRDLLSGHYLNLQIDWQKTDCSQFSENTCPAKEFKSQYRYYVPEEKASEFEKKLRSGKYDAYLYFVMLKQAKPQIVDFKLKEKKY